MRELFLTAAIGALSLGAPATGAGFSPPAGCETFLTVQNKSCSVSLMWRCDTAPGSDFWEAVFSSEGLESVVGYSAEYQWLDAVYLWDRSREELVPPPADPIDMQSLIETGLDTYDFTMHRSEPKGSYRIHIVGADRLTGATTRIDGIAMDEVDTRIEITAEDGTVEYKAEGTQYLSRDLGQFFLGTERVTGPDGTTTEFDDAPIDIILPGEPGFGSNVPLYNCQQQDAGFTPATPPDAQKETIHDHL